MRDEKDSGSHVDHRLMIARLSLLVDGELNGPAQSAVEAHLATCMACRAMVDDLRAVKSWVSSDGASATDRAAPAAWDELRAALPSRSIAGRLTGWGRVSIAASLFIVAMATAAWWRTRDAGPSSAATTSMTSDTTEPSTVVPLEALASSRLAILPAPESQALRSSLQIIDRAIADARSVRATDPDDEFVATYLAELLRRRADALRRVVEMADAERTS